MKDSEPFSPVAIGGGDATHSISAFGLAGRSTRREGPQNVTKLFEPELVSA
jgi:hypothetical protein